MTIHEHQVEKMRRVYEVIKDITYKNHAYYYLTKLSLFTMGI